MRLLICIQDSKGENIIDLDDCNFEDLHNLLKIFSRRDYVIFVSYHD